MERQSNLNKTKTSLEGGTVERDKQCPRCGSTNTDKQNGIWFCYDCEKEF